MLDSMGARGAAWFFAMWLAVVIFVSCAAAGTLGAVDIVDWNGKTVHALPPPGPDGQPMADGSELIWPWQEGRGKVDLPTTLAAIKVFLAAHPEALKRPVAVAKVQLNNQGQAEWVSRGLICWAVNSGQDELVDELLADGVDPNIISLKNDEEGGGETALHWAAYSWRTAVVLKLLQHGAPLGPDTAGAWQAAAGKNDIELMKVLLAHNGDVNALDPETGYSALLVAAANENLETVTFLVEHGAKVNLYAPNAPTALASAIEQIIPDDYRYRSPATIQMQQRMTAALAVAGYLIDHGADVNLCDGTNFCPLGRAVETGNMAMVELLIQHGADPNRLDGTQSPPVAHFQIRASEADTIALVEFFLARGNDVNAHDEYGNTLFHRACRNTQPALAQVLLDHGADPLLEDGRKASTRIVIWRLYPHNKQFLDTHFTPYDFWERPTNRYGQNFYSGPVLATKRIEYRVYKSIPSWGEFAILAGLLGGFGWVAVRRGRRLRPDVPARVEEIQKSLEGSADWGAAHAEDAAQAHPSDEVIGRYVENVARETQARRWLFVPVIGVLTLALLVFLDPAVPWLVEVYKHAAALGGYLFLLSLYLFNSRWVRFGVAVVATPVAFGFGATVAVFTWYLWRYFENSGQAACYGLAAALFLWQGWLHLRIFRLNFRMHKFERLRARLSKGHDTQGLEGSAGWDQQG